ncbi:protein kinase domain-containing protein [Achromobacter xylosoxidans]|uniref:protein kinase domain-containing protein n=1 Tax=Alcaligenes xylosoxydans xylosoxydans TaxID=85698 RepID=UPI0034D4812B
MLPIRYTQINEEFLAGGFGTVQKVKDTYLDRVVLFKAMQNPEDNDQLLNEIRGLSKARSRHVVEIYDVLRGENGDIFGIIIEYLGGSDYIDFHLEARSNPEKYMRILYQISCGLRDLHAAGVIHRDLKLQNMKESESGLLKIFDFGLSTNDSNYRTGTNRGTRLYSAPEFYVPNVLITPEMDMYALGICAWTLSTNQYPSELLEAPPQKSKRAPSINTVMAGFIHPDIVGLIDSCLDPRPTYRPTALEFSQTMARHLTRDRHRGLFTEGQKAVYELSESKRHVQITIGTLGSISARYDGLNFSIGYVTGSVFLNNIPIKPGQILHNACVLTFGGPELGSSRQWVIFSKSQPEVVF